MFYGVLGVIVLGGVAAIGYAVLGGDGEAATEMVEVDFGDVRELYEKATPVTMGDPAAPVKVVEFGDFQCPACGNFALRIKPALRERFIAGGQVQFVFYDFPLGGGHVHSFLAARAARCAGDQELPGAGENAYWAMHDKLFQEQPNWTYKSSVVDDYVGYAGQIGLDEREFGQCLRSDRYAEVVTANRLLGDQLQVRATPTVLVNNRRVDSGMNAIVQAVQQALGTGTGG